MIELAKRIVVLDTNVLLADPGVLMSYPDAEIVIPETVLGELDKLKTSRVDPDLRFRGREVAHQHVALKLIDRFVQELSDIGLVEVMPSMEGKAMIAVIAPTPATLAAAHSKATQQRIEAERAADRAAGYNEEEEEIEEAEDAELEEDEEAGDREAELVGVAPTKPLTKEQEAEMRRRQNREKLAQKRANEQFGLP